MPPSSDCTRSRGKAHAARAPPAPRLRHAVQTVGGKGYDGFALALVTDGPER